MKRKILFAILYIIPVVVYFLSVQKAKEQEQELSLIPLNGNNYIFSYADSIEFDGSSTASLNTRNIKSVGFSFTLRKGVEYPYIGMGLNLTDEKAFYDLSKYEYLELVFDSTNVDLFVLSMDVNIEGFTNSSNYTTMGKLQKSIQIEPGSKKHRILLNDLKTPEWWFDDNKQVRGSFPHDISLSRVKNIGIINHVNNRFDFTYTMHISEMKLVHGKGNTAKTLYTCLGFMLLITAGLFVKPRKEKKNLNYKKVTMTNYKDEEYERLVTFVGDNYTNPELSISMVSNNTGLSKAQIPELLQSRHSMMFKQYLNEIRVTEAKRLLKETDRQITEIAISVGYNYPSSFNRIFKQVTGTSPKIYRDEQKA